MSFLDSKYLFSDWNFDLLVTGFASAEDKLNKLLLKSGWAFEFREGNSSSDSSLCALFSSVQDGKVLLVS